MPREGFAAKRRRSDEIIETLQKAYPEARISLDFKDPFQLLVSVVLSAQTTDASVNRVTPALFARFPTPEAMAVAAPADIARLIRSIGLYRSKARHLRAAARILAEKHAGIVPDTMEQLLELPGVGRKTANVVLWNAHRRNVGIAVDTHVLRIARRLRLTSSGEDARIAESELLRLFREEDRGLLTHLFIAHGRAICGARKPLCEECPVARLCPSAGSFD